MVYAHRKRNISVETHSLRFMAYRTRNIKFEARLLRLSFIEREILHLSELVLVYAHRTRNISGKRTCFALWLKEPGILSFFLRQLFRLLAYRTRNMGKPLNSTCFAFEL